MSTKEQPGPFDGLERAAPDEPVFTLRAHDVLAPGLVHEWVRQRREAINSSDLPDEKRELELIQCREAEEIAWSMVDWRNGTAPVEIEEKEVPRYSGHETDADELEAKRKFDAILEASRRLHNSVAEIGEAQGVVLELISEGTAVALSQLGGQLKAIAMDIQPKRASYAHKEQ